jgi:hypothetical protein
LELLQAARFSAHNLSEVLMVSSLRLSQDVAETLRKSLRTSEPVALSERDALNRLWNWIPRNGQARIPNRVNLRQLEASKQLTCITFEPTWYALHRHVEMWSPSCSKG